MVNEWWTECDIGSVSCARLFTPAATISGWFEAIADSCACLHIV